MQSASPAPRDEYDLAHCGSSKNSFGEPHAVGVARYLELPACESRAAGQNYLAHSGSCGLRVDFLGEPLQGRHP